MLHRCIRLKLPPTLDNVIVCLYHETFLFRILYLLLWCKAKWHRFPIDEKSLLFSDWHDKNSENKRWLRWAIQIDFFTCIITSALVSFSVKYKKKDYIWKIYVDVNSAQCSGKPLFFPVPVLTNFWPPRNWFQFFLWKRNGLGINPAISRTFYYIIK